MNDIKTKSLSQSDIEHALFYIPADNRELWVKMAMATKSELGDDGFALWDYWSQSAPNYKKRDAKDVWRSINSNGIGIGIGSLIFEARKHGWNQSSDHLSLNFPKKQSPPTQSSTGSYALSLWLASDWKSVPEHPYEKAKGIGWPAGASRGIASGKIIGKKSDCIIIPIREITTDKVVGVQCINADGAKQTFGALTGNGFFCGNTLDTSISWFVVEGWTDAVSMVFHHYKGNAVAFAALGKGNMDRIAEVIVKAFSPDTVIIVEDSE